MSNYTLYYPTIEFRNSRWLWSAALLWDRIYRIVPEGYEPQDPRNIQVIVSTPTVDGRFTLVHQGIVQ